MARDRSRKYLALTDGSKLTGLDSSLVAERSQKLAASLTKPTELLLSTGAMGALLVGLDALVAIDFVSRKESAVRSCSALGEQGYAAAPAEATANSYVVLTESGEGCRVDGVTGPLIGTMALGNIGPAGQWQEKTASVSGATGVRDLYILFKGQGGGDRSLLDFDHWRFTR